MTLVEWLLVGTIVLGALNFLALVAIVAFLWNIDSNAAEARGLMNGLPTYGAVVEAVDKIERALLK